MNHIDSWKCETLELYVINTNFQIEILRLGGEGFMFNKSIIIGDFFRKPKSQTKVMTLTLRFYCCSKVSFTLP